MNWKKKVAKEWIWLICTIGGIILLGSILFIGAGIKLEEFLAPLFDPYAPWDNEARLGVIIPTLLVYFIRSTIWAIKEIRRK